MNDVMKQTVRELRRNQTQAEEVVWQLVRGRRLDGKKFLRQHPIMVSYYNQHRIFIADFYCPQHKLIIEIDGRIHEYQKEYDELRTYLINQKNIRVVRIKNEETESLDHVINIIRNSLA